MKYFQAFIWITVVAVVGLLVLDALRNELRDRADQKKRSKWRARSWPPAERQQKGAEIEREKDVLSSEDELAAPARPLCKRPTPKSYSKIVYGGRFTPSAVPNPQSDRCP